MSSALKSQWLMTVVSLGVLFVVDAAAQAKPVIDLVYCSNQNTGSSYEGVYAQYQTNGNCRDLCRGQYSVAIIQDYTCWCSNFAPSNQQSLNLCGDICPGFGDPQCGNAAKGLYAYFLIDGRSPSGTVGAVSTSTRSVSTFVPNGSGFPRPSRPISIVEFSSLTVNAIQQSSRTTSISVASSTPMTDPATIVTTVTGQVRTIIITPTSTPDSNKDESTSKSVGTGGIVGIVVGVLVGVGAIVGLAAWLWIRRRRQERADDGSVAGSSARGSKNGIPSRQVSQMSSAGLLGRIPRIRTDGLMAGNGPKSAESSQMDRRSLGTDQRLNPHAIYAHDESRLSNVSLQDNQDYSRQLRVANPDP